MPAMCRPMTMPTSVSVRPPWVGLSDVDGRHRHHADHDDMSQRHRRQAETGRRDRPDLPEPPHGSLAGPRPPWRPVRRGSARPTRPDRDWDVGCTASRLASLSGSGRSIRSSHTAQTRKVAAEARYGAASTGMCVRETIAPTGAARFGPATAPMVEAQMTQDSCRPRCSGRAEIGCGVPRLVFARIAGAEQEHAHEKQGDAAPGRTGDHRAGAERADDVGAGQSRAAPVAAHDAAGREGADRTAHDRDALRDAR